MTDNKKLIEDALTAFADRGIPAPTREHLSIALNAFEASLTLCGCDACATERRERTGITDHDRTSLARALHQIVYSPGANYDRAVPGIQEHMLACADKVAAALPWIVPTPAALTPTDDETEVMAYLITAHRFRERGLTGAIGEPDIAVSRPLADFLQGEGFRRSVVPEPSAETEELRKQIEKLDTDLGHQLDRIEELHNIADRLSWAIAPVSEIGEHSSANDPWENAIEYAATRRWAEPQGEPPDADAILSELVIRLNNEAYGKDDVTWGQVMRRIEGVEAARAALRAASAAEQAVVTSLPGNAPDQTIWCHTGRDHTRCEKPGCVCDCHLTVTEQGENR